MPRDEQDAFEPPKTISELLVPRHHPLSSHGSAVGRTAPVAPPNAPPRFAPLPPTLPRRAIPPTDSFDVSMASSQLNLLTLLQLSKKPGTRCMPACIGLVASG